MSSEALKHPDNYRWEKSFRLRWQWGVLFAILVVGAIASYFVFTLLQDRENERMAKVMELRVEWRTRDIQAKIRLSANRVESLAALMTAQTALTSREFEIFAQRVHLDGDSARTLLWAQRIAADHRSGFVKTLSADNVSDILDLTEDGKFVSAQPRDEYFPIVFRAEFEKTRLPIAYDLASERETAAAMARARDSGSAQATVLLHPMLSTRPFPLYRLFWPVYDGVIASATPDDRHRALKGFAVGTFNIKSILENAIKDTPEIPERIDIQVAPGDPSTRQTVAAFLPNTGIVVGDEIPKRAIAADETTLTRNFEVFGKTWTLVFSFLPDTALPQQSSLPLMLFIAGLMLTALIGAHLMHEYGLRSRVEREIEKRTTSLRSANQTLEVESRVRETAERALGEQVQLLNATLEAVPLAIICLDKHARVRLWNQSATRIFGYSETDVLENVYPLTPEEQREKFQTLLRATSAGKVVRGAQLTQRKKDGSFLEVSFSAAAMQAPDREKNIVISLEDMTERLNLEQQLRQSQKMEALGQLTGGIVHDLNNLLQVIIGNVGLLRETVRDDPEFETFCDEANDAALRGAELTHSLLAFARRQPLQPRLVELDEVVSGAIKLLRRILDQNIQLLVEVAPETWPVVVDPVQLAAALTNLATNARDAMLRGGRLTIAVDNTHLDENDLAGHADLAPGDFVRIQVADNGAGMTPEVMSHIFEPFFTTKRRGSGTGLGLSMVFGFVKQSSGHIAVESEPGLGSTFRLYLPRATGAGTRQAKTPEEAVEEGNGETVLVVEDDPSILRLAVYNLRTLGYQTLEAANAAAGLDVLSSGATVNILFSDVVMAGGLNGIELASIARKRISSIKIVLASGFPDENLDLGDLGTSVSILRKPYEKRDLARALRQVQSIDYRPG